MLRVGGRVRPKRAVVGGRVEAARRLGFVGRDGEKELVRRALAQAQLPFVLLYIHGQAGIGKTSLLREFADIAIEVEATPILLDARDIEPAPDSFLRAFSKALDLAP